MVPSGMAPQFIAINFWCFLALRPWMIFENTSFPTPLSPVIKVLKSVDATLTAVFNALSSRGE